MKSTKIFEITGAVSGEQLLGLLSLDSVESSSIMVHLYSCTSGKV